MLRRVIALLAAFAVLAERAADRSAWVRLFVLWILRRAETAAAAFVFDETGTPPPALESTAAVGNGAENARSLATRFRALASELRALLPLDSRFQRRPAPRGLTPSPLAPASGRGLGGWAPRPFDTS